MIRRGSLVAPARRRRARRRGTSRRAVARARARRRRRPSPATAARRRRAAGRRPTRRPPASRDEQRGCAATRAQRASRRAPDEVAHALEPAVARGHRARSQRRGWRFTSPKSARAPRAASGRRCAPRHGRDGGGGVARGAAAPAARLAPAPRAARAAPAAGGLVVDALRVPWGGGWRAGGTSAIATVVVAARRAPRALLVAARASPVAPAGRGARQRSASCASAVASRAAANSSIVTTPSRPRRTPHGRASSRGHGPTSVAGGARASRLEPLSRRRRTCRAAAARLEAHFRRPTRAATARTPSTASLRLAPLGREPEARSTRDAIPKEK